MKKAVDFTVYFISLIIIAFCFMALQGCYEKTKPVYVGEGQMVEIAEPCLATCWITNKETNKRELRRVNIQAGWYAGRLKGEAK